MSAIAGRSRGAGPGAIAGPSGIVLAGGRSARFGSDKLVARVDGDRLVDRAVAALAAVATEVVVVVEPGASREPPAPASVPVRIVTDPEAFGGPLVGLLSGLEAVSESIVVVIGGDMPSVVPEVLRILAGRLAADPGRDAALLEARGRVVPLPIALRTGAATAAARRLIGDGERRLGAIAERLPCAVLGDEEWRPFDPSGDTLRDVDEPGDLDEVARSRS